MVLAVPCGVNGPRNTNPRPEAVEALHDVVLVGVVVPCVIEVAGRKITRMTK